MLMAFKSIHYTLKVIGARKGFQPENSCQIRLEFAAASTHYPVRQPWSHHPTQMLNVDGMSLKVSQDLMCSRATLCSKVCSGMFTAENPS